MSPAVLCRFSPCLRPLRVPRSPVARGLFLYAPFFEHARRVAPFSPSVDLLPSSPVAPRIPRRPSTRFATPPPLLLPSRSSCAEIGDFVSLTFCRMVSSCSRKFLVLGLELAYLVLPRRCLFSRMAKLLVVPRAFLRRCILLSPFSSATLDTAFSRVFAILVSHPCTCRRGGGSQLSYTPAPRLPLPFRLSRALTPPRVLTLNRFFFRSLVF